MKKVIITLAILLGYSLNLLCNEQEGTHKMTVEKINFNLTRTTCGGVGNDCVNEGIWYLWPGGVKEE